MSKRGIVRAMKSTEVLSRTGRRALRAVLLAALATTGGSIARAQDKSTPLSKVERLNRAPVNKEVLRVQLPRPTVVKLKNGLTLVLLENHKLPTISFALQIRPGQLADPNDLPGLASFTAEMLREGTERRTSAQIADEVDSLGASLEASSSFGASYTSVSASGLISNAPQIVDLMSDIVLHPTFPAAELTPYKQRAEADLEQNLANPVFLAQQAFRRALYGEPPLSLNSPTKDSIEKVTAEDLKRFHEQHYRPGNTLLGAAGDFKTEDMRALIEKYFGAWTGAAEAPTTIPPMAAPAAAKITLVDRPASVQTYIIGGDRGIRRTDPDYYALVVMNQVLGGGPQSRLFLDLREEHGYTYGAYSGISADLYPGYWRATAPVRTPVTDGSMTQFMYEFKRINDQPVPEADLDDARRAIVAKFALSLEQPSEILQDWLTTQYFGLPADYWDKYPDHIAAVDAAAVQAAAKKYVDLGHMQWVCVGDRKQIEEVLKKYGNVTAVDAEGKPEN
ncbi:MAG TPA: pitrilysin family protein [Candidatus Acidoferrum sp.]|nr:pitrilysin family protein [Candidatus Acidoferrum sp.]